MTKKKTTEKFKILIQLDYIFSTEEKTDSHKHSHARIYMRMICMITPSNFTPLQNKTNRKKMHKKVK